MSVIRVNVILFGIGNVGSTFIQQVLESQQFFLQQRNIDLRIPIITNATVAFYEKEGVRNQWEADFSKNAVPFHLDAIFDYVINNELENLIVVDATASSDIIKRYIPLVQNGFHIVSANKKANTIHFDFYKELRRQLKKFDRLFLYETNVGAGLPVVQTIQDLHLAGEKITKIRGVFSGTISYVFNRFGEEDRSFSKILMDAEQAGLTEPDSREDLSGNDVARKLLILARELGYDFEFSDIKIQSLVPEEMATLPVKHYNKSKVLLDAVFENKKFVQKEGNVLRYVGDFDVLKKELSVKLVSVPASSALGQLRGADNLIEIYSDSYGAIPMVIQGAGAGKQVTARGVLADVLKVAEQLKVREGVEV
ncbi:aspartate kinase [Flavobacterium columnare]|nr:aspartate kinase [Flavobacterium columnare] [Flavobacterium columnare NBRC 100251 = ATCC 23463]